MGATTVAIDFPKFEEIPRSPAEGLYTTHAAEAQSGAIVASFAFFPKPILPARRKRRIP
jgi:hypothetical protein